MNEPPKSPSMYDIEGYNVEGVGGGIRLFLSRSLTFRGMAALPLAVFAVVLTSLTHWGRTRGEVFFESFNLPIGNPIGVDFRTVYKSAETIRKGLDGYVDIPTNVYPPGVSLLYVPLTFLEEKGAYIALTYILIAALVIGMSTAVAVAGDVHSRFERFLFAIVMTALLYHSYPVLFALERGNYDILAATATFLGIFALIRGRSTRGGMLFALGCVLKIYPLACLPIFIRRLNLRFLVALAVTGLAGLLCLGKTGVTHFYRSLRHFNAKPYFWQGNHSLASYANWMELRPLYATAAVVAVVVIFLAGCGASWSYRQRNVNEPKSSKFAAILNEEQYLLGMAFALMGLVTSASHDYKLVIQLFPFLGSVALLQRPGSGTIPKLFVTCLSGVALAFVFCPLSFFPKTPFIVALFTTNLLLLVLTAFEKTGSTRIVSDDEIDYQRAA